MLLEARKHPVLERVYAAYGRRLLRRTFARLWLGGEAFPEGDRPSIALLNHSAWWDPLLTLYLSHDLFRRDGYGIMQGEQLVRYPFFRAIGCFGVTDTSLADVRALSECTARTLEGGARRTLWVFPQGALLPARAAATVGSGSARLARAAPPGTLVVPLAVRYVFRAEQHPECVIRVGTATAAAPGEKASALAARLETALRREVAQLDAALLQRELTGYTAVLQGRGSLSGFYERTIGRWTRRAPRAAADARPRALHPAPGAPGAEHPDEESRS